MIQWIRQMPARWDWLPVLTTRGGMSRLRAEAAECEESLENLEEELDLEYAVSAALRDLYRPLISADASIQEMAGIVLDRALQLTGSIHGYVSSIDKITGNNIGHTTSPLEEGECSIAAKGTAIEFSPDQDGKYPGLWGHALNTGKPFFSNSPDKHPAARPLPAGHIRIDRFLSVPVQLHGKPAGQIALANSCRDYTDRDLNAVQRLARFYALALQQKEAQEKTQAALCEKEVLLREIHHRVKNNLQVISSLLNLQAGNLTDPRALEMLNESQNRVRSMAMVHEQLHRSKDLSKINFAEYVRNLAASLFCSYGVESSRIALILEIQDTSFGIDTAIPCGLIIQELVSNSLKYAFPDDRSGEIRIALSSDEKGGQVLSVEDDGVGLPDAMNCKCTKSLGLRLVRILAEQVDASFACSKGNGTQFRIKIPETQ